MRADRGGGIDQRLDLAAQCQHLATFAAVGVLDLLLKIADLSPQWSDNGREFRLRGRSQVQRGGLQDAGGDVLELGREALFVGLLRDEGLFALLKAGDLRSTGIAPERPTDEHEQRGGNRSDE